MTDEALAMPKVWDLTREEAQAVLEESAISFSVHHAPNLIVPEGVLFAVSPVPGTVITPETRIILTISTGPPVRADQE